jgi:tetratricopeptide (TPR) repeat protein
MPKHKNSRSTDTAASLPQTGTTKQSLWKPYLVFTIFAFVLYGNTLNHSFVFDDAMVLTNNDFTQQGIKGIPDIFKYDSFLGRTLNAFPEKTAEQLKKEQMGVAGGRYRPLSLVTFALEIQFFGKENSNGEYTFQANALVSHFNNILLYLLTTCLLYLILHRLFPPEKEKKWYLSFPFIITLLFLAHPIHTEAVANIKGRDEIMTLLGALAALWFTIKYFDTEKDYNLLLSGLCMFLGLLSKENAITFLAVIPITTYYFVIPKSPKGNLIPGWIGKTIVSLIPLVVAAIVFLLIRANALGGRADTSAEITELLNNPFLGATNAETKATIFYTLLLYIKLLFLPYPLTWDYYPYHIEIVNWSNPIALLSLFLYFGITIYAVYGLFKKRDVISYSIWFYLLPLSIVSNLFFPIGAFMAERFVFISSIGFCIFITWLINKYIPKISKNITISTYLTYSVFIIILSLYSIDTISRNKVWKNNFTLMTSDIKTSKNSAKGNYEAGKQWNWKAVFPKNKEETQRKDEFCEEALKHLKRSIEIYPEYRDAFADIGTIYFDCYKDIPQTLHYYAIALQLNSAKTYDNAKKVLTQINTYLNEHKTTYAAQDIIKACDELLNAKPDFGEAYYTKGLVYGKNLQNIKLSLLNLQKADSFDFEKTADFYQDLGVAYGMSGIYDKSIQYLLKAIELAPSYNRYISLGLSYQGLGDMENAKIYFNKGEELKKNQTQQ